MYFYYLFVVGRLLPFILMFPVKLVRYLSSDLASLSSELASSRIIVGLRVKGSPVPPICVSWSSGIENPEQISELVGSVVTVHQLRNL